MSVAYDERDHAAIGKRKRKHKVYELASKGVRIATGLEEKHLKSILVYPAITNATDLADVLNRLAFALPYKPELTIQVAVSPALVKTNITELATPAAQDRFLGDLPHFELVTPEAIDWKADHILLWKEAAATEAKVLMRLHRTSIIDKNYFSAIESSVLREIYYHCFSQQERQQFQRDSIENYTWLLQQAEKTDKAYCFVTGPSFDTYPDFKFDDQAFKVICNSTVKNNDFLNHIGHAHVQCFADPVFHFSPCLYSATFRKEVVAAFAQQGFYITVPERTYPLMLAHYPQLKGKLIGMPHKKGRGFNFPTPGNFWLHSSGNILTYLMLPVASAAATEVSIFGADGRQQSEKYFWKHSKTAQYNDLMQTAFDTHPSFFRDRDYEDYYEEHCAFLESLIQFGEQQGKTYQSLTPSFIPALEKRPAKTK